MKNKIIYSLLLVGLTVFAGSSHAQVRTLTGYVTAFDSIAVANVEVKVQGSKEIAVTDEYGRFDVKCLDDDKIKISAKGFYPQKIVVSEETKELNVNLTFKPGEKNVDVAMGYGHISEKDGTYAVSTIRNSDKNKFAKFTNMYELIRSISPSIIVSGGQISIGGMSSLNGSTAALIMVDGVETNSSQLAVLDPMNIKSVDIVKNGGAAIYGMRGANGVVVIKTLGANQ